MNTIAHTRFIETTSSITAILDRFPGGCDPDFDTGLEEMEREFAELRLQLAE